MRTRLLYSPALAASLFMFAPAGLAYLPPARAPLPNWDSRAEKLPAEAAPTAEQRAAVEQLRARLPEARVEFDPATGAPTLVSAGEKFLSGANGQGQAISAAVAAGFATDDPHRATKAFLREHSGLFGHGPEVLDQARVAREFTTPHSGLRTVVWQQQADEVPVFEAVLISHTTPKGELVNVSSQFVPDPVGAAERGLPNRATQLATPTVSARQAVALAARNVGEDAQEEDISPVAASPQATASPGRSSALSSVESAPQEFQAPFLQGTAAAKLLWLPLSKDRLALCWDVVLTSRTRQEMFRVLVDVQTGESLLRRCLTDYLSDATYRVYTSDSPTPFSPGYATPASGQPPEVPRSLLTFSALNPNASPNGWIDDGVNETRGNNVDAHTDLNNDNQPDLPRPQGSPFRVFDFALDLTQAPSTYRSAAVVQLFYWNNFMHDRLYELGFTEAAGNFQSTNFARGGLGNDAVQADAQDGGGYNNANFSTPPDGSAPRMQMYLFNGPTPDRDGDFDAEVVLHEYTHGLSNRRVGGGVGISALQTGGMGEGWSDFYPLALLSEPGDDVNGAYASGGYLTYQLGGMTQNYYYGVRRYPYCTDLAKNPLTFKDIDPAQASSHAGVPRSPIVGSTANEVHNMGEVWCVTLWEARANLINKYGWTIGNQLILQLVTDGMNLSPANPNFLQARDAILQADQVDNGGANRAALWAAFAKRGMGYSASSPSSSTTVGLHEAYDVPDPLAVLPALLAASGPPGGPFTPNPAFFVLTNTGNNTLSWTLANTSLWVSLSPAGGTLSSGTATNVAVALTTAADSFAPGIYRAGLWFTNQTSGVVQSGTFALAVVGRHMFDDSDPGIDLSQWSDFGGIAGSTVLATNYGGSVSSPNSLWFGDGGSRYATTLPINTTNGGTISFSLRLANGSAWPWEVVDLPGEGVVLECSTNNGASFTILGTYNTTAYYNWMAVSLDIPASAQAPATLFRWRQLSHTGPSFDHWALDNVSILAEDLPPMISTQPQDQTMPMGDSATLSVTAFGTQPLSYQWSMNGTNLNGATTSSLVWTNVQFTDTGTYWVSLSNRVGTVASSNAILTVTPPPPCVTPPASLVSWWRTEGDCLDQYGGNTGTLQNGTVFALGRVGRAFSFDGTDDYVKIPKAANLDVGEQVTVEFWMKAAPDNAMNTLQGLVSSDFYAVSIAGGGNLGIGIDAVISTDGGVSWATTAEVNGGGAVVSANQWHHVAATYDGTRLQLYIDGQAAGNPILHSGAISPMAANSFLSIGSEDGRKYCSSCLGSRYFKGLIDEPAIYNRALSAAEIAAIYNAGITGKCVTFTAPFILVQPANQTVTVGANVTFSVTAGGTSPLSYQWQYNGTNIAAGISASLMLTNVQLGQSGNYSVVLTNAAGSIMSSNALLTVNPPPPCVTPPVGLVSWWPGEATPGDAVSGNNGTLQGAATFAAGVVGQTFSFDPASGTVIVPDSSSLRLTNQLTIEAWINTRSISTDRAIVSKMGGAGGANGYQFVLSGNTLVAQFNSPGQSWPSSKITSGGLIATGVWYHVAWTYDQSAMKLYCNGAAVATNVIGAKSIIASSSNLRISGDDNNHVYFDGLIDEPSVYNRALSASEIAAIYSAGSGGKCGLPPSILVQPQSLAVTAGSSAIFAATVAGSPPLSYQWQFNGTGIAGATASVLTLTNVQSGQAGTYLLLATNAAGSVISSNALLTVATPLPCVTPPVGLVSWWPGEATPSDAASGYNGTLQGAATFAAGVVGQAFSFAPASGTVIVPDSSSLRLTNQLTIEAWINTRSISTDRAIVSKMGGTGGNNGYQFLLSGNTLIGQFNSPGQGWPSSRITSGGVVATGMWHHVAWTYDQSAMKLYCNGMAVATNVIGAQVIATSSSPLRISGDANNQVYFDGLIDEPSVYNRALSASEIAAIYSAGSGGKCGLPPSILVQPQSQTVTAGSSAIFAATVTGSPPLSYQWQFNGAGIAGATASVLTLTNVQSGQAGTYLLLATNAAGSVISSNALLTVVPPPPCVTPPVGLVSWWPGEATPGDAASGNNGTLQGAATFAAGVVGQTFSFDPASGTVIVPDSSSLRLTNQLTIEAWINTRSISTDRAIVSKMGGAGGANGYQFVLSGNTLVAQFNSPGQSWPSSKITSGGLIATGVWYHVAWTYDQSAMKLYCNGAAVATNIIGAKSIIASSSNLRISGDDNNHVYFDGLIDEPSVYNRALSASEIAAIYSAGSSGKCGATPAVQTPPLSQIVECSGNASFSVTATGLPPLAYQWYFGPSSIPAATGSLLILTNVGFAQAGSYSVVITNAYGSATGGPAVLTIVDTVPPIISACAPNRTLSAITECSAFLPDLTSEVVAADASGPVTVTQAPPAGTLLELGVTNVAFTVRDFSGNAASCLCTITVADLTPPTILTCISNLTLDFDTNCQALLPNLTGTNNITASDNCSSVVITQTPPAQTPLPVGTNTVFLTASDTATNQTIRAIAVIVPGEPHISSQPVDFSAVLTSNAAFSVTACGANPLLYQWQHASTNLPNATNAALTLGNVKTNEAGSYRVIITCPAGTTTSAVATLTVLRPPVITRQPRGLAAAPGGGASFSVSAQGLTPFAYQWQKNGSPLPGQTKASLTITNVQAQDFGTYTAGVTNADGAALSDAAMLTLAVSPNLTSLGWNSGTFMLTVPTELGPTYVLEYKDCLDDTSWMMLATIAGTGLPIPLTDNGLTNMTRFYRVRVR